jgi:hypothetical protein
MPVVISPAYVLTGAEEASANAPLILWENLVTTASIAASSAASGYPASNLANPSTHLLWKAADDASPSVVVEETLTITVDREDPIDAVAVARHNWGSTGATIHVEELVDGDASPEVWTELIETTLADDAPVIFRLEPASRYAVRIRIEGGSDFPRAAVVYCGLLTKLPRNLYVGHIPMPFAREVDVANGMSESSEFLGRIVLGRFTANGASLKNLPAAWVRTYLRPFLVAAEEAPFFFAWRPSGYPLESGFVWLTNKPKPVNQSPNGFMSCELQFNGIV